LIRYSADKGAEVLLEHIYFANGVALAKDESFVLVVETPRSRVLRYWLKGPKGGSPQQLRVTPSFTFFLTTSLLPQPEPLMCLSTAYRAWRMASLAALVPIHMRLAFPAGNDLGCIPPDGSDHFWLPLVSSRDPFIEFIAPYPFIRAALLKIGIPVVEKHHGHVLGSSIRVTVRLAMLTRVSSLLSQSWTKAAISCAVSKAPPPALRP
jgi:hypothetical protein